MDSVYVCCEKSTEYFGTLLRILILSHGSRGDVEPLVALGHELVLAGHEVTLGAPEEFSGIAVPSATHFIPFKNRMHDYANDPRIRAAVGSDYNGLRRQLLFLSRLGLARKMVKGMTEDLLLATRCRVDMIVYHCQIPGDYIAKKLGVPAVPVELAPGYLPSASYPYPGFPFQVPRILNRQTYVLDNLKRMILHPGATKWRRKLPGAPWSLGGRVLYRGTDDSELRLQCFTKHIWNTETWEDSNTLTTGYWFLPKPEPWEPSSQLKKFLHAADPPIYIGFGSVASDPEFVRGFIVDGVRRAGVRAILGLGWSGINLDNREDIFPVEDAPFSWLFPRMSVIVHHGGIGTIGSALYSGRPQIIYPAHRTTSSFARAVASSGAAIFPERYSRLTSENLSEAINRALLDSKIISRAAELGKSVRSENGVAKAVDILERRFASH